MFDGEKNNIEVYMNEENEKQYFFYMMKIHTVQTYTV